MARRNRTPGSVKSLTSDFSRNPNLGLEERAPFRPDRYTSGTERQSELEPSPRAPAPARARPAPSRPKTAPRPKTPPLPPRRPPGGGGTPPLPSEPPPIPSTGAIPTFPQYDPMGTGPTGFPAPPNSGSTLGDPYMPPPYGGEMPPMAGPGSDRMQVTPPLPPAALNALPRPGISSPGVFPQPPAPQQGPPMPTPGIDQALQAGVGPTPGPQGLLDSLGAFFKRYGPAPLGGM